MLRIGLLLTGAGALDGSDPLQVAAWRIAAAERGHVLVACAPDVVQHDVVGPQGIVDERRHARAESYRIASGVVERVEALQADELDALVVPGGLGAVKTLCKAAVGEPVDVLDAPADLARALLARGGLVAGADEAIVWLSWVLANAPIDLATDGRAAITADIEGNGHRACPTSETVLHPNPRVLTRWMPSRERPAAVFRATTEMLGVIERELDPENTVSD